VDGPSPCRGSTEQKKSADGEEKGRPEGGVRHQPGRCDGITNKVNTGTTWSAAQPEEPVETGEWPYPGNWPLAPSREKGEESQEGCREGPTPTSDQASERGEDCRLRVVTGPGRSHWELSRLTARRGGKRRKKREDRWPEKQRFTVAQL